MPGEIQLSGGLVLLGDDGGGKVAIDSNCCCVDGPCCGGDSALPVTLYVTYSGGCDNLSFAITRGRPSLNWAGWFDGGGPVGQCDNRAGLFFDCDTVSGSWSFRLVASFCGPNPPGNGTVTVLSCNPLHVRWVGTTDCDGSTLVTIDVTE